jgi:dimethylpropiothetin dethiomethylase
MRLRDHPDLGYLVGDFHAIYRYSSAGGSRSIRTHLRRVRESISDVVEENPEVEGRDPQQLPVTAHLGRALDLGSRGVLSRLGDSVSRVSRQLTWEYGYERVPRHLVGKYAYCEVVGPRGPVVTDHVILGLVLLAPNTTYPQHHHRDIEESYVSIAGDWSENDGAVYAPGSLILNVPGHEHRITTGASEPCLLAYAWIGPPERLRVPGMSFARGRGPVRG